MARLMVSHKTVWRLRYYENASPESLSGRIFLNNMKGTDYSVTYAEARRRLRDGSSRSALILKENTFKQHFGDVHCLTSVAWRSQGAQFNGFSLRKHSPLTKFFRYQAGNVICVV